MTALAAAVFVFLTLATGALYVVARPFRKLSSPDARLRALAPETINDGPSARPHTLRRSDASSLPVLSRWLRGSAWGASTASDLRRANIQLRVGEYALLRALLALLLLVAPLLVFGTGIAGVVLAAAGGSAGFLTPSFYVRSARRSRLKRIERQVAEFLPALASSLRSGFAFQQALGTAVEQVGPPLADELNQVLDDMELGAAAGQALRDLGERVGSTGLDMVITAILVQRTTGGNLPEILDGAAESMRERERIRGEVQTLTAQQRLTGLILSVYPILVGLLLLAIMPSVWSKLFTEPVGQVQLVIALVLQVVGFVAIRRALQVDV